MGVLDRECKNSRNKRQKRLFGTEVFRSLQFSAVIFELLQSVKYSLMFLKWVSKEIRFGFGE